MNNVMEDKNRPFLTDKIVREKTEASIIEWLNRPEKRKTDYFTEAKELCSGIFWIITDSRNIDEYKLLIFDIPYNTEGNSYDDLDVPLNAKKGLTYNHKSTWETEIKNNSDHKPYNKKEYNYYPRGRVELSGNCATIFLNPHINTPSIINEIKRKFGLSTYNIQEVRVVVDGSDHYKCFIDREEEEEKKREKEEKKKKKKK